MQLAWAEAQPEAEMEERAAVSAQAGRVPWARAEGRRAARRGMKYVVRISAVGTGFWC